MNGSRMVQKLLVLVLIYGALSQNQPLPTTSQLKYQQMERGAIIHFNIATSAGSQGCGDGEVPPTSIFNPTKLDTDQWIESMRVLGIKYAVLVAKHNCGFCTWPTAVTFPSLGFTYNYSVNSTTLQKNVVQQFVESCIKAGIKPGFYYSVVVNTFLNVENGKVQGGPLKPGQAAITQKEYYDIVLAQLNELWSQYGDLAEIWFDGGYQGDIHQQLSSLLQQKQPNAVIFNGYGLTTNPVRWVGTESGHAPYPNWATGTTGGGDPDSPIWCPAECDFTLQNGDTWFYDSTVGLRSLSELISIYHESAGRGCNFLIDYAPTPEGILPPDAVTRYKELGDYLSTCYGSPVASNNGQGMTLVLKLPQETEIDRVIIEEDISQGQRVRSYTVQGSVDGVTWQTLSTGTSIGNKKIDIFTAVSIHQIRLVAEKVVNVPIWYNFSTFKPCPVV